MPSEVQGPDLSGHGGIHAVAAARAHGASTLFTLSGAHIFPLYDAAIGGKAGFEASGPAGTGELRLVDVRHEQTATFAAEATGKLTRTPGFAALTAGPGVTNGVSAIASAHFNGVPMVVVGGRAPAFRWGSGALQEFDHPPLLASITKRAFTADDPATIGADVGSAFALAGEAHRGPVFLDVPMDRFYTPATAPAHMAAPAADRTPDPEALASCAATISAAKRPVLVISSDVWADGAEAAALRFAESSGIPVITTGMGRGILPRGHRLLVTRARSSAFAKADVVIVAGAPLDFRLAYGIFGAKDSPAAVVHLVDSPDQVASQVSTVKASCGASLAAIFDGLADSVTAAHDPAWARDLTDADRAARAADAALLSASNDPIHPARIYGELLPRLAEDAVVIGDGGDFVSFAGRFVEPAQPGCWLDPGPYGCLGTGMGYAIAARIARPEAQVVLLLGDGAAGFSFMDLDTLVRHRLPVLIVIGNNSAWGLEKHPMRLLHGYDVLADLAPQTRYDQIAVALGAGGELVTKPDEIGPAIDRGLGSGIPYVVNVATDAEIPYPRSTTGL